MGNNHDGTDADLEAVMVDDFMAARPSEDGSIVQLLVKLNGETKVLSIPRTQTLGLAFTIIRMEEECRRLINPESVDSPVTTVVATGMGVSELGNPALTLISDEGLKLSFAFTPERLTNLSETIKLLQEITSKRSDEKLN